MQVTRHWHDISFAVEMTKQEAWVELKVYEISGWIEGDTNKPIYPEKDSNGSEQVETLDAAAVYLSGSIKWDGCSNLNFDEQDRVMLHFCSKTSATNIGVLLGRLYELAAELMPEQVDNLT